MMWFPTDYNALLAYQVDPREDYLLVKSKKKARCGGCGQFMSLKKSSYMQISNFTCHMKEACIYNVYLKIKERNPNFELAVEEKAE